MNRSTPYVAVNAINSNGAVALTGSSNSSVTDYASGYRSRDELYGNQSANPYYTYTTAYYRDGSGALRQLVAPTGDPRVAAYGLNDNGLVVGQTTSGAVVWNVSSPSPVGTALQSVIQTTNGIGNDSRGKASDINNGGLAVGTSASNHGFTATLWNTTTGTVTDLANRTTGAGMSYSHASAINESGVITGAANINGTYQAYTYNATSGMQGIGFLNGGWQSSGGDINSAGKIVGWSNGGVDLGAAVDGNRAFLYDPTRTNGQKMIDVGLEIVKGQGNYAPGGTKNGGAWGNIHDATAINDFGQITGIGFNSQNNHNSAYLLSPVVQASANALQNVNLGNMRVGDTGKTGDVVITNMATPNYQFSDQLAVMGAGIIGAAKIVTSPVGTRIDAGNSSTMVVGLNDTATAGNKTGQINVQFGTDGTKNGVNPFTTSIGSQTITVSGNVYRTAVGDVSPSSVNLGAVRVGQTASASLDVSNTAANDGYSEKLNASVGATTGGATGSGGATALAAGSTKAGAIAVGMDTTTAGAKSGTVAVNYVSTGVGTSGLADISVGQQLVNVAANVYQSAKVVVTQTLVDFGILHVGDSVTRNLQVANGAEIVGLNDRLTGSIGGTADGLVVGGTVNLGAGESGNGLFVGIDGRSIGSGLFDATALARFASHNAEMSDLDLGSTDIRVMGQLNQYAKANLGYSGDGALHWNGNELTLDLGYLYVNQTYRHGVLNLLNDVFGYADSLGARIETVDNNDFDIDGLLASLSGIGAGQSAGFTLDFDALNHGVLNDLFRIHTWGYNESGYRDAQENVFDLRIVGVGGYLQTSDVPEPGSLALVALALAGLGALRRRNAR